MALQRLLRGGSRTALQVRRFAGHAPTVFDKMVQVTVTDLGGNRHLLRGRAGDKLIDLLVAHEDELGGDAVLGLSPEGRGVREALVTVPNEYLTTIPEPAGNDLLALNEFAPEHTSNSRLASKIKLEKQLNNLSIALGRIYPWRTV